MMYFWFVPALIILAIVLWALYAAATKKRADRTEGRTVFDKAQSSHGRS